MVVFAALVTGYAMQTESSIHEMVENAYKVTLAAAFVPLAAGLFWRRANNLGAALAIVFGLTTWIAPRILLARGHHPTSTGRPGVSAVGMLIGLIGGRQPSIAERQYAAHRPAERPCFCVGVLPLSGRFQARRAALLTRDHPNSGNAPWLAALFPAAMTANHLIELVCPAGSLPALKTAVDAGADCVYVGFKNATNARNFTGLNFTDASMREGIRYAHDRGRKGVAGAQHLSPGRQLAGMDQDHRRRGRHGRTR